MLFLTLFLILCITGISEAASVKLAWDPSADPKVIGYKVYYGTETGNYSQTLDVKGRSEARAVVDNLDEGRAYYFSVTASYADGTESGHSNEVSTASGKNASRDAKKGVSAAPGKSDKSSVAPGAPGVPGPAPAGAGASKVPPSKVSKETPQGKIPPSKTIPDAPSGKIPPSKQVPTLTGEPKIPPSRQF
ncbi:MAG: fibronectin type III domain-containing protein [Syntrophobacteraceae bacterium]